MCCHSLCFIGLQLQLQPKQQQQRRYIANRKETYPGMVANVKYINDSTIYWKSIDENDSIDEQTKAMKMRKIGNGKFFISWIGDYGVTSSQVVDLNKKTFIEFYTSADILGNRVGQMIEGKYELDK